MLHSVMHSPGTNCANHKLFIGPLPRASVGPTPPPRLPQASSPRGVLRLRRPQGSQPSKLLITVGSGSRSRSRSRSKLRSTISIGFIIESRTQPYFIKELREANISAMAARANRPRPGPSREDPAAAQEETSMWNQIVADLKMCNAIKEKASELVKQVIELERIIGKSTRLCVVPSTRHL